MLDLIYDIVGYNDAGQKCHPFKGKQGTKKGFYSYTLLNDNKTFKPITETELRKKIEDGHFTGVGRIRMIPEGTTKTSGAGALSVHSYLGKRLV
ncbi:hypothetical protein ALT761_02393 [Alteromonas sp. 76-1]|jgi:hypothetical protein|uniref:hypothetical protein n=1 Tax=Alteromonas TaxID=226 RepID=UPI000FD17576|nr:MULTISPECIES: hypothetical protein [Alteromonas]MCQ8849232.1 hypothetical protein [Alteromonas stellipolaris]VEL97389.1 hypothetical protein ALT761_02393 [Alteromonas sp. 76-1]